MVISKTCGKQLSMMDIAKAASKEYGITLEEFRKIIKQPEHPYELRDEFAMAAMQGIVTYGAYGGSTSPRAIALKAYTLADAMLEEREVKNEN